jgi:hypothetical protein
LEEASAPNNSFSSEEKKAFGKSTPPVFWRASANIVGAATSLLKLPTFDAAVSGPDQVH